MNIFNKNKLKANVIKLYQKIHISINLNASAKLSINVTKDVPIVKVYATVSMDIHRNMLLIIEINNR
jgi:hypothetical protein